VNPPSQTVTIVTQRPGHVEMPWVRFLLGDWAGPVVDDPERRAAVPYSLLVCDRPDTLRSKVRAEIRRLGTVGLLHVGDRRYRTRLESYTSFAYVWRTHYHSALTSMAVRQLPLGPAAFPEVWATPTPAALRRPAERLYTWCFVDRPQATHAPVVEALRRIEGGYERLDDGAGPGRRRRNGTGIGTAVDPVTSDPAAYVEVLADSVFVACPMSDQHIETTRVYDALEAGAIPVVERRRRLDYFDALLGDHPLPTVRTWSEASGLLGDLLADHTALTALHDRVVRWWTGLKQSLARAAQEDVERCVAGVVVGSPLDDGPLNKPAPRWRGRVELLRHNGPRVRRRG
jgi:hypothetical protein